MHTQTYHTYAHTNIPYKQASKQMHTHTNKHTLLHILRVIDPPEVEPDGSPEVDQLHVVQVQEEGHRGGQAQGKLRPLGPTVVHVLDLDVGLPLKRVPLVLVLVSPLPQGLPIRFDRV